MKRPSPTGRSPQGRCEENLLQPPSCSFSGTIIDSDPRHPPPLRLAGCKPSFFLISSHLSSLNSPCLHSTYIFVSFSPCLHSCSLASRSSPPFPPVSLLSLVFHLSLLAWGVWENLESKASNHLFRHPSPFGHREAQFTTPACHLDNYCERGGQQQQEKIHDYLYLGLQALQQKGEEIEEETKTDSGSCLGELRGDSVCVFLVVCACETHSLCF